MKIYDITGIGANLTGSFSGSFKEIFTGTATTASYVQYSNVANKPTLISGSSQIADFGYATTGSNQFDGSQAITGSLTVTGQVIAQTLNVQQVTSSIVYSSGSNIFGNDLGNTQQLTGSVSITGSLTVNGVGLVSYTGVTADVNLGNFDLTARYLNTEGSPGLGGVLNIKQDAVYLPKGNGYSSIASSFTAFDFFGYTGASTYKNFSFRFDGLTDNTLRIYTLPNEAGTLALTSNLGDYLPLTGGTLTGPLNGTSAVFSSTLTSTDHTIKNSANAETLDLFLSPSTLNGFIDYPSGRSLTIRNKANGFGLTLSSTGEATFSADLSVGVSTLSNPNSLDRLLQVRAASPVGVVLFDSRDANPIGLENRGAVFHLTYGTSNILVADGASGKVGIGTASPVSKLQLNSNLDSTGYTTAAALSGTENIKLYQFANSNTSIDNNGETGILLSQNFGNSAQWGISVKRTGSFVGDLIFRTRTASATSAEQMRITSQGYVLVGSDTIPGAGTTTIGSSLGTAGFITAQRAAATVGFFGRNNDGELFAFYRGATQVGNISVTSVLTTYNTSSDYRLKEDLQEFNGLEKVQAIKVYDYKWKAQESRMNGVLAHELAEVLPYAVSGEKDEVDEKGNDKMQGVDYSKIVPILIKAIQELKTEIDSLKNQIK